MTHLSDAKKRLPITDSLLEGSSALFELEYSGRNGFGQRIYRESNQSRKYICRSRDGSTAADRARAAVLVR